MHSPRLFDENLPLHAATLLRSRGFDAVYAREVGLRSAPDEAILALAASEERVCITLDRELHRILAESGAIKPHGRRDRCDSNAPTHPGKEIAAQAFLRNTRAVDPLLRPVIA